jgi:hypothetical protein
VLTLSRHTITTAMPQMARSESGQTGIQGCRKPVPGFYSHLAAAEGKTVGCYELRTEPASRNAAMLRVFLGMPMFATEVAIQACMPSKFGRMFRNAKPERGHAGLESALIRLSVCPATDLMNELVIDNGRRQYRPRLCLLVCRLRFFGGFAF